MESEARVRSVSLKRVLRIAGPGKVSFWIWEGVG